MPRRKSSPENSGKSSEPQSAALAVAHVQDVRARAWEFYLRGYSYSAIGRELGVYRETVSGYIEETRAGLESSRQEQAQRLLDEAVERLRHVQMQAWRDHDEDDSRERRVLEAALGGPDVRNPPDGPGVRFTSQRAQYLRVALDCEREIARLLGLYSPTPDATQIPSVVFRFERVESSPSGAQIVESEARK